MKKTIQKAPILLLLILLCSSCNFKTDSNPQSIENIKNLKTETLKKLDSFKDEGLISASDYKLISKSLSADCDTYLNSKNLTCEQIEEMAMASLLKFNHIKMNDELFAVISNVYFIIASSNQVRNISKVGGYCNPGEEMWKWYEAHQTTSDKLNSARDAVKRMVVTFASDKSITLKKMDSIAANIYADINKIEKDTLLSNVQIKTIITSSLNKYNNSGLSNHVIENLIHIHSVLARAKNIDIEEDIRIFYQKNIKQPQPLTYQELRVSVDRRLAMMLEHNLISENDYSKLRLMMLDDIDTLLKGSQSEEQILNRLKDSLSKIKDVPLDTEDREFIAETYYDIAKRCNINIGNILNEWLYE